MNAPKTRYGLDNDKTDLAARILARYAKSGARSPSHDELSDAEAIVGCIVDAAVEEIHEEIDALVAMIGERLGDQNFERVFREDVRSRS